MSGREYKWNHHGKVHELRIEENGGQGRLTIGDSATEFHVKDRSGVGGYFTVGRANHRYFVHRAGPRFTVWIDGTTFRFERVDGVATTMAAATVQSGEIRSNMPGKVLRIDVREGDAVEEKQAVIVMESMKMETVLHAPRSGRVAKLACTSGQVVDLGDLLAVIE